MKHLAAAILLVCGIAQAQTTLGETFLYRGVATGKPLSAHPNLAACAASAPVGAFSCEVRGKRVAEPLPPTPCAPAPAASSVPVACVAPTVGSWTQTTTYTRSPAPACTLATMTSPLAPPAGACTTPQPPTGTALYFSQAGNNANPGTEASPKQTIGNVNAMPAGMTLYLKRGDTWNNFNLSLKNPNATVAAPLVFDAYGTGANPVLRTAAGVAVMFGTYNESDNDGGYTFRNIKFDGMGTAQWGFFIQGVTRNVSIENSEITGFQIGVHAQNMGATGNMDMRVVSNHIHHNSEMGMLGDANNLLMDGNLIEANNFSGSGFNHGTYLGGHATNGRVRGNIFRNNSQVNGVCTGGGLTVHGQWDGLLIENNVLEVQAAAPGCWGISVTDGYSSAEFFRNVVVRGNSMENFELALAVRGAPGILLDSNKIRSNQPDLPSGIVITPPNEAQDDPGINPIVRNNTVCFVSPAPGKQPVVISVAGGTQSGTIYRTGAEATTGACAR